MSISSQNAGKPLPLGMGSVRYGKVKKIGALDYTYVLRGGDNYAIVVLWRDDM